MIHFNHAARYTVSGYVDLSRAGRKIPGAVRHRLNELLSEHNQHTLLELDGVVYMETKSFQVFEALLERIHHTGAHFRLRKVTPSGKEMKVAACIAERLALGQSEDLQYSIS
jgi:anti-anti-sigma regulatory factor